MIAMNLLTLNLRLQIIVLINSLREKNLKKKV